MLPGRAAALPRWESDVTAPGLRGFVLEARPGDEEDLLSAALAALAQAFTGTAEPAAPGTGTRRRTWLDTFDWRLYRGGLILAFEQARGGGRLLLSQADGTPQAEQAVTGWPRRPPLDLPEGPVRDRIIVLTRPRALLPIVRAVSTASVTRLLNADGKTVARLVADHVTVTAPSQPTASHAATSPTATTAELAPRLAVTEVRGYLAQARKASALLACVPGVSPASQGIFIAALTALGRHPADYSSSVAAEITAEMPARVAVARLLLRLLDTMESNVDGVLRDIDTEFLHDLRVAVRRTRSAVKLLGAVLPDELAEHYKAEFKWLGDVTTPVRDLDVHLLGFDAMAGQVEAASPADLEPLRAFLARRRAREVRRLATALRGPRFRAIADDWRKALLEIRDTGGPRRRRPTAATLALSTTALAFRRIAAQGSAITQDSPPESLHDLRKRAKELRYLLEFFAPLHDPVASRKVVGDLKQLQDCLGDFQDGEVQREEIHSLADAMLADRAAPAATLLAMGEIAAKLARSQAQAREEFAARFTRFAGPAGRERVRVLLEGRP
jgi:CHAD domain-containing protein